MPMKRALLLVFVVLSGCATQIQHGLEERDANEIVSALVARGFDAKKVPEKGKKPTWAIELDDSQATEAMRVLTELKLPRPARLKTQTLAASTGLIDTPSAERLRQLEAQEGDIEESLETMDGVTSASVELVVPAAPRPGQPAIPSKASVLLRVHPDALERLQQQRSQLRALVAASVEGLQSDDVVLVVDPVVIPSAPPRVDSRGTLRPLVMGLGVALSVLAMVLVFIAYRMRVMKAAVQSTATRAPEPPVTPPHVPPRPVINPSVQRKVA
ncbi:MAG: flagellar M-ring protein FliF [Archangium gephyra]|uniref:Flagellar M-ring protein FliF n=1 Tax=Archangium gephyra TaxID=48 RepID=A0A2W5UH06_9BACT|nr:MAG: flagellar M-ring protein FliF [Archangium gephyra]